MTIRHRHSSAGCGVRCPVLALLVLLLAAAMAPAVAAPPAQPMRIVSMNICADELVLRLADRAHVRSVSWLAHDPIDSNVADLARGIHANRGLAEEIVALGPDLVVAGLYTTRTAVGLLRRVGVPLFELDVPATIDDARRQMLAVAEALGEPARGRALVDALDAGLAEARADAGGVDRPTAIVYQPNGFTVGSGSLVDAILTGAGLRNLSVEAGLGDHGRLALETLVRLRPDFLVVDGAPRRGAALAWERLDHRALRALPYPQRTVPLPNRLWTCAGPGMVDAMAALAAAAQGDAAQGEAAP